MLAVRWSLFALFIIRLVKADYIMQQTIKAFAEFHAVHCHILVYSHSNAFREQRVLLDFYKAVIENDYKPTVLENINNENRRNSAVSTGKHCNKPLRSFIIGSVSYMAKYMIAEERREDMRNDVWLLFVANCSEQELLLSQIKLSMRSEVYLARREEKDCFTFWEIYQPARNVPIRIIYYGDWNARTGLTANQLTVVERRRDFGGAILRAAEFQSDQLNNIQNKKHVILLREVSELLKKELNFTVERLIININETDYQPPEHPQNVIIRILARNEADISMIGLLLDTATLNIVDYSGPVVQTHFRVYVKKNGIGFESGFHFLNPFPIEAWYNVILTTILIATIILFMYYIGRKTDLIRTQNTPLDLCVTMHQMFCLQGGALQQELCSMSLVFVFFNLWAYLIRTIYAASLASNLAIEQYTPPFHSLEELLENGQYEFGIHQFSAARELYYKTDNLFLKKLNKVVMDQNISNLPRTYLEGLQRVCSQKNYAFMANRRIMMELESQIPCKLQYLPAEVYTVSTAYAMSKCNEYLPFINRWLHLLNQAGLVDKIQRDIFGEKLLTLDDSQSFKSLTLEDTYFIQIILIVGVLLSITMLFIEIVHYRTKRNRRARYS